MLLIHQAINAIRELVLALTIDHSLFVVANRHLAPSPLWPLVGLFPPAGPTHLADDRHRRLVHPFAGDSPPPDCRPRDLGHLRFPITGASPASRLRWCTRSWGPLCPRRSFSGASYSSASRTASAFCPLTSPRQFASGRSTASCWRAPGTGWSP